MNKTYQRKTWEDEFGADYLKRNVYSPSELNDFTKKSYGITKDELINEFLKDIPKDARILEVGTNIGNRLLFLQSRGFTNLYGIEIQQRAINYAKNRTDNLNIIQGDALNIPFKDGFFDLVFTCGVLIHISPDNITTAINEISRVSAKYIWGFEYFAEQYTDIIYRGEKNLLWKTNFMKLYLENNPDLKMIKEKKLPYIDNPEIEDHMFILRKS